MSINDDLAFTNPVQEAIFVGAHEEAGLWEVLIDIVDDMDVDRKTAFELLKGEVNYLEESDDIFLIYSEKLYDMTTSKVLPKWKLLDLTLADVEFKEEGPFYYFSTVPEI